MSKYQHLPFNFNDLKINDNEIFSNITLNNYIRKFYSDLTYIYNNPFNLIPATTSQSGVIRLANNLKDNLISNLSGITSYELQECLNTYITEQTSSVDAGIFNINHDTKTISGILEPITTGDNSKFNIYTIELSTLNNVRINFDYNVSLNSSLSAINELSGYECFVYDGEFSNFPISTFNSSANYITMVGSYNPKERVNIIANDNTFTTAIYYTLITNNLINKDITYYTYAINFYDLDDTILATLYPNAYTYINQNDIPSISVFNPLFKITSWDKSLIDPITENKDVYPINYTTVDDALYIYASSYVPGEDISLSITKEDSNPIIIDWGDGSTTEITTVGSSVINHRLLLTYTGVIKIKAINGAKYYTGSI